MNKTSKINHLIPYFLAGLVILIYIFQTTSLIHHIQPVMDEGTYLLKGKWLIDGTYQPFQDYGPLINKPPFSFISLGISQFISPGLESGRIIAIIFGSLTLIGIFLIVNHLCGKWWGVFSIFLFTISPAWEIYYSRAMTQVVSSFLVAWSLFFILVEFKRDWHFYVGIILASLVVMIRQNMLPYFGLVIVYIIWETGFNKGWRIALVGIISFFILNAIYWPKIYAAIWAPQLPSFINSIIFKLTGTSALYDVSSVLQLNKDFSFLDEIRVFFSGVRFFFIPLFSAVAIFITVSPKSLIEKKQRKTIFLSVSFLFLIAIHFLASILQNNFLYSFPAYYGFFLPLGIILIPLLLTNLTDRQSKNRLFLLIILVLMITTGVGFSLQQDIATSLLTIRVPRLHASSHQAYELWDVLSSRFNLSYSTLSQILPAMAGFLFGLLILFMSFLFRKLIKINQQPISATSTILVITMMIGLVLSPTDVLAGNGSIGMCENDVLARNEEIGTILQNTIKEGSRIYWEGTIPTPLLYLHGYQYFPAQLNMQFNYLKDGNTEVVEKNGFWNDELAQRWINEADYLVLSPEASLKRGVNSDTDLIKKYELIDITKSLNPCSETTVLKIYKKIS